MRLRYLALAGAVAGVLALVGGSASAGAERGLYIVVLDDPALAAYEGGIEGLAATDPEVAGVRRLDVDSVPSRAYLAYLAAQQRAFEQAAEAALGRDVEPRHRYDAALNGVAVALSPTEAGVVATLPGVDRVVSDLTRQLLTDAGPQWIGAPSVWTGGGGVAGTKGEGIVVGVIDTGVNHDHPSFADPGPTDGYDHANPKGRYLGECDPVTGAPFCNDKLIGFYDFIGTTPEDDILHGSHTASTAAGNVLDARLIAPTMTLERRIAGVAPHANVISYKACTSVIPATPVTGECQLSALVASINQATLDEVDVINYSIGGGSADPWTDLDAVAFRNARNAGIFASVSAGNDGPGAGTIGSPADAPWVTAVAASTHDRNLPNSLVGMSGGGSSPPADIVGKGVTAGYGPAPIVYAGDYGSPLCGEGAAAPDGSAATNPFPPGTFDGEIVVCDRGTYGRVEKAANVAEGGAGGYVLANDELNGDSLTADAYAVPGAHISFANGNALKAWLASGSGHTASITGAVLDQRPANGDVMASFSSRGPNPSVADVLKPDVTGPGVDVLAAFHTPLLSTATDPEYGIISGTSMSAPHTAGAGALLRAVHPEWTPDEVRAALVTTAFTTPDGGPEVHGVLKENGSTPADPFDVGGGRVALARAARAGLVLDEATLSYESANPALGGDPTTLNLPTLAQDECAATCVWTRTLRSTASSSVTWTAAAAGEGGLGLSVAPTGFTLAPGETVLLTVTADAEGAQPGSWSFGRVVLSAEGGGAPEAHLPVAVRKDGDPITIERTTLHFHGNAHDGCTGVGNVDLTLVSTTCPDGPTLSTDAELDPGPPAVFASNPALTCAAGFDRCATEPNWLWRVDQPTTIEGPMTVEFWWGCPGCAGTAPGVVFLNEDFEIRLFVDGVEVMTQVVRDLSSVPAVARLVRATVTVPRTTANERVVLRIEPFFVHQREAAVYYDSSGTCLAGVEAPCDSRVHVPVVREPAPDLRVTNLVGENAAGSEIPKAGQTAHLRATIANDGDGAAGASQAEFLLDGEHVLGVVDTPAIAPGESTTVSLPWNTKGMGGEHTIRVTADSAGVVAERNAAGDAEANNSGTLTVTVKGNKVANGSFEASSNGSSPDNWSSSGSTGYAQGGSDGERSVTAGPGGVWLSDPIPVEAGAGYAFSVAAAGAGGTVAVQQLSAAGAVLGTVALPVADVGGVFRAVTGSLTAASGVTQVRVRLAGPLAGTARFDDVQLFEE